MTQALVSDCEATGTHTHTHTFVAVPFEIIDGADMIIWAGLRSAHCPGDGAFAGLRTVLSHKCLFQLRDEGREGG